MDLAYSRGFQHIQIVPLLWGRLFLAVYHTCEPAPRSIYRLFLSEDRACEWFTEQKANMRSGGYAR